MLGKIYSVLGTGSCFIKGGEVVDSYLLSDKEIKLIEEIAKVTPHLPEKFKIGFFEHEEGKAIVLRHGEGFICFPAKSDNVMNELRRVEAEVYDKILSH
ncbi:MAG: hypothetical protein H0Z19_08045 [Archaeoglobus sp.]|uniref:hypothetical protein n=1 Tax=Archaeoglobus sp. TaxID=1872626 RepID=UPI001E089AD6|nr:hypothetical protein [Archaeoglobus sp.]MBO8180414.1 hypothetical protein [Archaeoglobus sp.]